MKCTLFGGAHNKDCILGSIPGSPLFRAITMYLHITELPLSPSHMLQKS